MVVLGPVRQGGKAHTMQVGPDVTGGAGGISVGIGQPLNFMCWAPGGTSLWGAVRAFLGPRGSLRIQRGTSLGKQLLLWRAK